MDKSLLDALNEFGYDNPKLVVSTLKALAYNGVTSVDILMKMETEEIQKIKGIGPKSMALIGKVITKEQMVREQKKALYDRYCNDPGCTGLRDWFRKASISYLSACQLEKILKRNGITNVDIFMKTNSEEFLQMNGIAAKRLEIIARTKKLIAENRSGT